MYRMSTSAVAGTSEGSRKRKAAGEDRHESSVLQRKYADHREKRAAAPTATNFFEERETKRRRKNHGRGEAPIQVKESRTIKSSKAIKDVVGETRAEQSPTSAARRQKREEKRRRRKEVRLQAQQISVGAQDATRSHDVAKAKSTAGDDSEKEAQRHGGRKQPNENINDDHMRVASKYTTDQHLVRNKETSVSSNAAWRLSNVTAGRFLDHDPLFVRDESGGGYLITATHNEVQLLSLETSTPVRSFSPQDQTISCFTVAENLVLVASADRSLWSWDWTIGGNGKRVAQTPADVQAMAVPPSADVGNIYYACSNKKGSTIMCGSLLHRTTLQIRSIEVLGDCDYLVARGPDVLLLGSRRHGTPSPDYVWVEIPLSSRSTCMDARLSLERRGGKSSDKRMGLRLAIGNENGKIHLFDDVSHVFQGSKQKQLHSPRLLHWHREAVSALKFSKDGNYLISGGAETVLVLWQLDTGSKQFLPHLTSQIECIVVSPEGDRYAIQMGDNSIMVLNTSELKPIANFAGLQMAEKQYRLQSVNTASAAVLHPQKPAFLIHAVPASRLHPSRPFLQTFDIPSCRHVSRQAITRNNVTDFNLGPEGTPITPPDIKRVAVSFDGLWLATVDEWTPPDCDLDGYAAGKADLEKQRLLRREVYLKIWGWNQQQGLWTLATRFDSPHTRASDDGHGAGTILSIISDPSSIGFSTVGEDAFVKLWKPRKRVRQGLIARDTANNDIPEWHCARTIKLEDREERADTPSQDIDIQRVSTGCLAYSSDGSMLAAAYSRSTDSSMPAVHFLDTSGGGTISKTGLAQTRITAVGFLDRYLVIVAHPAVYVWDLVDDCLVRKTQLLPAVDAIPSLNQPALAVNPDDGTFALVTDLDGIGSLLEVFNTLDVAPTYSKTFANRIVNILAGKGLQGYTLLFADSTIQTLSPKTTRNRSLQRAPRHKRSSKSAARLAVLGADAAHEAAAEDAQMIDIMGSTVSARGQRRAVMAPEDDRPVVRPEQLTEIFDVGGVVMPPVKDMFRSIVSLYGRKALTTIADDVEE